MYYRYGSHTVYNIEYHFVWVTKYRYKVLTGDVALRVRELVRQTCEIFEIKILQGVVSKDHVHILVSAPPNMAPSEIMRRIKGRTSSKLFEEFPVTFTTPEIKVNTTENAKFTVMEKLAKEGNFGDGTITTIDGIRVDYPDGWGLVRPSNTSPVLTLRFEADGQAALDRIQRVFKEQLKKIDSKLAF